MNLKVKIFLGMISEHQATEKQINEWLEENKLVVINTAIGISPVDQSFLTIVSAVPEETAGSFIPST